MTRSARHASLSAAALAACLIASGCGSSGSSKTTTVTVPAATSTPATTPATAAVTTPAATTPAAAAPSGAAGVTKPGTTLKLGQEGRISYGVASPKTGATIAHALLGATADSVRKGSILDLANFKLDAASKQLVPFYVTVTFANRSKRTLTNSGLFGLVDVFNAGGDEAQHLGLIGDFPKCDGAIPDKFTPGTTAKECDVYLLPKGQSVTKLQLTTGLDDGIFWRVG